MTTPLFTITGLVLHGHARGSSLGFPTANIQLTQTIPEGIYAAKVNVGSETYQAASFVGAAKTFGEKQVKLESYLIGFNGDLYGLEITVRLYEKIRDNAAFASVEELVPQIKADILATKAYFQAEN